MALPLLRRLKVFLSLASKGPMESREHGLWTLNTEVALSSLELQVNRVNGGRGGTRKTCYWCC